MSNKKAPTFWLQHLVLVIIVLVGGVFVLLYKSDPTAPSVQSDAPASEEKNNIEENLARFYEEFSFSSKDPIKERYGNFVVALDLPKESQTEQLVATASVEQPSQQNWEGEYKFRSFAEGTTIRTEAMKYAQQEGVKLIWDLNQDFIIRHRFLSENSLLGALDEVASAIDANFIPKVNVYFCHKKDTIIITENAGTYVEENCRKSGL
ncbi:MAG: TcpQ domain-containing protein [Glaciecola sp.]|jgi:hypothetical protein